MKFVLASLATLLFTGAAWADYPEFDDNNDAEAVFLIQSLNDLETLRDKDCKPHSTTEWHCFARDARGESLGISHSFKSRDLAAGRALANCQRKSDIASTCAITLCKQPKQCKKKKKRWNPLN